jgi:predicted amidohydrolase
MKVGVFQFNPIFGETANNLERITETLMKTDADLVVLPELCVSGYQFVSESEARSLCEAIPEGRTVRRFVEICREKTMFLVAGVGELEGEVCYNASVLVGAEGLIAAYRKIHLFAEEKNWFRPGDHPFQVSHIGKVGIGMMICYDWIYPESARSLALAGADIVCHPSNLILPYCPDAMITRSIENQIFTVTANRTGTEARGGKPPLTFIGQSQITSPKGERLVRFGPEEEGIKVTEIDVQLSRNKRITPKNHLWEDRRPKLYS